MAQLIGAVTVKRCRRLLSKSRERIELASRYPFQSGDQVLEIESMRPRGGSAYADRGTCEERLGLFAAALNDSSETVRRWWWVAARWPRAKRAAMVSRRWARWGV